MNRRVKKNIFISLVLVAITAAGIGYYLFNKGPLDVRNSNAIKIKASVLYEQFNKDSTAALKSYSNKVVEIDGEISSISVNQQKQQIILLKTSAGGAFINCTLEEDPANIKVNDLVKIKGICSGMGQGDTDLGILGDLYLTRCYLIK